MQFIGDRPARTRAPGIELALVGAVAVALVLVILQPWPLDVPIVYRGDTFQHLALVETSSWIGSPGPTEALAAPHGLDWSVFPTGTERLHLVVLTALRNLSGDPFVAMNLHILLGLVATALVSHVVLRRLGCRPVVAAAAACLFSLAPAALLRLEVGHLFLFALFPVPLGVYAATWAVDRPPPDSLRPSSWRPASWLPGKEWLAPLAAVSVIALTSAYFTVFTALAVASLAVVVAVRRGDLRPLVAPALLLLVLIGVAGASLAPDLLARRGNPAAESLQRPVADSDSYGLRAAQMVLPRPDHPVPALASWGEKAFRTRAPGDRGVALGLAGTAGVVALAVTAVRRAGRARDDTDRTVVRLSAITAATLAIATAGGGGFVLATLGLTQVRAWSRMAPFVLFCCFAALGLLAQRRYGTARRFTPIVVLVAVLALADLGARMPDRPVNASAVREDAALVADLTAELPDRSLVAQLPAVSFPDDLGAQRLLAPSIHAQGRLRFTAGAFRGSDGDWQETWLVEEPARAARALAAAGVEALLVQRTHHLVDDPEQLERELVGAIGDDARTSSEGTWIWFDLRPLQRRLIEEHGQLTVERVGRGVLQPIGLTYDGAAGRQYVDGTATTFLGADGAVVLHPGDDEGFDAVLSLHVTAEAGAQVQVLTAGEVVRTLEPGGAGETVAVELELSDETTRVRFRTVGAPLSTPGADGSAHLRLSEVRVVDVATRQDGVLTAGS